MYIVVGQYIVTFDKAFRVQPTHARRQLHDVILAEGKPDYALAEIRRK